MSIEKHVADGPWQPIPHSFEWAKQQTEAGHRVRRTTWPTHHYVGYDDFFAYSDSFSDFLKNATDWAIYEDPAADHNPPLTFDEAFQETCVHYVWPPKIQGMSSDCRSGWWSEYQAIRIKNCLELGGKVYAKKPEGVE